MPPILYNNIASFPVNKKKKLHVLGINFSPELLNEAEYVLKNYVGAKKRVAQESRNFWLGGGESKLALSQNGNNRTVARLKAKKDHRSKFYYLIIWKEEA